MPKHTFMNSYKEQVALLRQVLRVWSVDGSSLSDARLVRLWYYPPRAGEEVESYHYYAKHVARYLRNNKHKTVTRPSRNIDIRIDKVRLPNYGVYIKIWANGKQTNHVLHNCIMRDDWHMAYRFARYESRRSEDGPTDD